MGRSSFIQIGNYGSLRLGTQCYINFNGVFQTKAFTTDVQTSITNNTTNINNNIINTTNNTTSINALSGNNTLLNNGISALNLLTTNISYTGDSTFISGILETNYITTQRILFPLQSIDDYQYSAFTNVYKSTLDTYINAQPPIIYNYYQSFTATETGTGSTGTKIVSITADKLVDTTITTKLFKDKIYMISATLNVNNLKFLQKLEYTIRLFRNTTVISESASIFPIKVVYNGAGGAEFNTYTLVCPPYYFKSLNNYIGDIKIEVTIAHNVDSNNGTTVQFYFNANLQQIN
jgi:hypothetical protein